MNTFVDATMVRPVGRAQSARGPEKGTRAVRAPGGRVQVSADVRPVGTPQSGKVAGATR